jgi:C_GCAxxG_C_C family probable redox protein
VLLAVCRELKIDIDEAVIPRIASGFGGGMGNTGGTCGAIVGAVMAMGLTNEPGEEMADGLRFAARVAELRRKFEAEMGSSECREMTGLDLTTEEGVETLVTTDIPQRVCFPAVAAAYRLALEAVQKER